MFKISVFGLLMLSAMSCCKENIGDDNELITLQYQQTQCADRWAYARSDSLQLARVAHFLDSTRLYFASISIRQLQLPAVCDACGYHTGKLFMVSTLNSNPIKAQYAALGFR